MKFMERRGFQLSVRSLLWLTASVAFNLWCFRVSAFLGFVALNITKHVLIAQLCQSCGVNREIPGQSIEHPPGPG
jgi:hypothetical protein